MSLNALVQCHCDLTSFAVVIDPSALPLKSALCHCHSCRHTTGQLFATWAVIPGKPPATILESRNLVKYSVSTCHRFFCKRCGASVLNVDNANGDEEWEVATGVLVFDDPKGLQGKLKRVQLWVEDVKDDGGAVGWINQGKLAGMDRHWRERGSEMVGDETIKEITTRKHSADASDEPLLAQCRCQGVSFHVKTPGKAHNSGLGKFGSCLCVCTSCRIVTGFEITAWTSVPKDAVVARPELAAFLADASKLGHYESSPKIARYFCLTCGATIFYHDEKRQTIDVATGLFEPAITGAVRDDARLDWRLSPEAQSSEDQGYVGFAGDAVDADFVKNLSEGMRLWDETK